jgi:hypothetical protein
MLDLMMDEYNVFIERKEAEAVAKARAEAEAEAAADGQ